ncbi:hypothetical protein EPUL_000747 [Erysiphe pulchra]|uniref:Uncharacterized protein n=1 Tax=Erysiphe pulchra TaxID=225359 RepID=A0A2S4Q0M3_9PEZI|nr:hypothetical protein EPUL_000747 [Erysiphe pulchra]
MPAREALPENYDDMVNNLSEEIIDQENIDPFENANGNLDPYLNETVTNISNNVISNDNSIVEAPRRLPQWFAPPPTYRTIPAAYTIARPRSQTCCKEDQVVLNEIPEPQAYLRWLWTSDDSDAKVFRNNSRTYSRSFAFKSFKYSEDRRLADRGIHGVLRCFSIHGQIYHQTGAALRKGAVPRYAQLYFVGSEREVEARTEWENLNSEIVRRLTELIEQNNPFVEYYHTALRSLQESELEGSLRVVLNPDFRLVVEPHTDRRRYNLPTTDEVAVVIPDGAHRNTRDVILFARNGDGTLSQRRQWLSHENSPPIEILNDVPSPSLSHLHTFGCKAYVHIPNEIRPSGSKLQARAIEGIFVGYTNSSKIFRIYISSKSSIQVTRQVYFPVTSSGEVSVESMTLTSRPKTPTLSKVPGTFVETPSLPRQSNPSTPAPQELNPITPNAPKKPNENFILLDKEILPRRGSRERKQADPGEGMVPNTQKYKAYAVRVEPKTYNQAMKSNDSKLWKEAILEEMDALSRYSTFEIVPRPKDRNVVGSKRVFKVKHKADVSIERYKARLVAKEFSQQPGTDYDDTYAPVARYVFGTANFILGIQIDITEKAISLYQTAYIIKIIERFGMQDCSSVGTPLEPVAQLTKEPDKCIDDITIYQSIVGSLMYACIGARPDLAHAVTVLSQFSSSPTIVVEMKISPRESSAMSTRPTPDLIQTATRDELQEMLKIALNENLKLEAACCEARMSAAHHKLRNNLLSIESQEALNRMEVENYMLRREASIFRQNSQDLAQIEYKKMLKKYCEFLKEENIALRYRLKKAKRLIKSQDLKLASAHQGIDLLQERIRQNRRHINDMRRPGGPLFHVSTTVGRAETPKDCFAQFHHNLTQNISQFHQDTSEVTSEDREKLDALLLAGSILNQGNNNFSSHQTTSTEQLDDRDLESTFLSNSPDPFQNSNVLLPPIQLPLEAEKRLQSQSRTSNQLHTRRRKSRDSTISVSDMEELTSFHKYENKVPESDLAVNEIHSPFSKSEENSSIKQEKLYKNKQDFCHTRSDITVTKRRRDDEISLRNIGSKKGRYNEELSLTNS